MIQSVRQLQLGNLGGKEVTGTFNKGDISTEGGAWLVERAERKVGIVDRFSTAITDRRDQTKVVHSVADMLRQRVFAIACAYEDCNDFDDLAADGALKCAVGRLPETDPDLASVARGEDPGLKVLMMSGHFPDEMNQDRADDAGPPLIRKPFSPQSLLATVQEVLQAEEA